MNKSEVLTPFEIGSTPKSPRSSRLFEYFFLLGREDYNCADLKIIFQYPHNQSGGKGVKINSQTLGVHAVCGEVLGVRKRYDGCFFTPIVQSNRQKRCYSSVIITNDDLYYVAFVTNVEPFDYYPEYSRKYQTQVKYEREWSLEENGQDEVLAVTRYYCIVSRNTALQTHEDFLLQLLEREKLSYNERMGLCPRSEDGCCTSALGMLMTYYSAVLPRPQDALYISLPYGIRDQSLVVDKADSRELLAAYTLPTLFSLCSVKDVVCILGYLLQETSVLVHCTDAGICSKLVLALTVLMRPFSWTGIFIAVVHSSIEDTILDYPGRILAGLTTPDLTPDDFEDRNSFFHIWVDSSTGQCWLQHPEDINWELPDSKKLEKELKKFVRRGGTAVDSYGVCEVLKRYYVELMYFLSKRVNIALLGDTKCLSMNVSIWVRDGLKNSKLKTFWNAFFEAHYFAMYNGILLSAFLALKTFESKTARRVWQSKERRNMKLEILTRILFPAEKYVCAVHREKSNLKQCTVCRKINAPSIPITSHSFCV